MPRKTPVALFAYNRANHLANALASLAACARLDECDLYIFCDGAKSDEDQIAVEETRVVAWQGKNRLNAFLVEREENLGLAKSIVSAVTELCNEYGRCIVVEDDLLLHPQFIDYMLTALDRYEHDDRVYQVSGYMFPVRNPTEPDAFFMPLTTTWGWATWGRAWKAFDWHATGSQALKDPKVRTTFDLNNRYPYAEMLEQRIAGLNSSWGILWYYAVFNAGGLVLHPRRSLVRNEGFDNSGTHCAGDEASEALQLELDRFMEPAFSGEIEFPSEVTADYAALERIGAFLGRDQNNLTRTRLRSLLSRVKRKVDQFRDVRGSLLL